MSSGMKALSNFITLKNKETGKDVRLPITAEQIAANLDKITPGWPRVLNRQLLFTHDKNGAIVFLPTASNLFAELCHHNANAFWAKSLVGGVSREDFFLYLHGHVQCHTDISMIPHYPPIDGVYYVNGGKFNTLSDGSYFEDLLSYFSPASLEDKALIAGAFMSPFWGGPPGDRPAFFFEALDGDGRGYGKSALTAAIGAVAGGFIDMNLFKNGDGLGKAIINSDPAIRVIRFDNIKSNRLSHGEIEGIITSPMISGHMLRTGTVSRQNNYTYLFTLNDASLSKDLAQRAVRIKLIKPSYSDGWKASLSSFIRENREKIVGDILGVLSSENSLRVKDSSRFPSWDSAVLSRAAHFVGVDSHEVLLKMVTDRKTEVDSDDEIFSKESLFDMVASNISRFRKSVVLSKVATINPEINPVAITKPVMLEWLRRHSGNSGMSAKRAHLIFTKAGLPNIADSKTNTLRFWLWFPTENRDFEEAFLIADDNSFREITTIKIPRKAHPPTDCKVLELDVKRE